MILPTPRLLLREFVPGDWAAIQTYHQDPAFRRFYDDQTGTPMHSQVFVGNFVAWQMEQPRFRMQLAITLPFTGELIGNVGLRRTGPAHPVADMGYELSPAHWGRGYATEAARALLDWGFAAWGLTRVHAHCLAENTASARVLARLGMKEEGRQRQHEMLQGRLHDILLFGILREEWAAGAGRETHHAEPRRD